MTAWGGAGCTVSAMDVDGTDMDFGLEGSDEGDGEDSGSEPQLAPRAQVCLCRHL